MLKDSFKEKQRGQRLEEELRAREQELESTLSKQKEVRPPCGAEVFTEKRLMLARPDSFIF